MNCLLWKSSLHAFLMKKFVEISFVHQFAKWKSDIIVKITKKSRHKKCLKNKWGNLNDITNASNIALAEHLCVLILFTFFVSIFSKSAARNDSNNQHTSIAAIFDRKKIERNKENSHKKFGNFEQRHKSICRKRCEDVLLVVDHHAIFQVELMNEWIGRGNWGKSSIFCNFLVHILLTLWPLITDKKDDANPINPTILLLTRILIAMKKHHNNKIKCLTHLIILSIMYEAES